LPQKEGYIAENSGVGIKLGWKIQPRHTSWFTEDFRSPCLITGGCEGPGKQETTVVVSVVSNDTGLPQLWWHPCVFVCFYEINIQHAELRTKCFKFCISIKVSLDISPLASPLNWPTLDDFEVLPCRTPSFGYQQYLL
jgi:hypothetical protein